MEFPAPTTKALYTTAVGFDPKAAPVPYILEGRRGEKTRNVELFDVNSRAHLDAEITKLALCVYRKECP